MTECVICGERAKTFPRTGYYTHQDCPRCGEFKISGTLEVILQKNYPKDHEARTKLSGWVRKRNMFGEVPHCSDKDEAINSYLFDKIKAMLIPGIPERASRLLEFKVRRQKSIGQVFNRDNPAL